MLKFIGDVEPFFQDNYIRIGIREYSRIGGVSPPTASSILSGFEKEGILERRKNRNAIEYSANRNSDIFRDLMLIYWKYQLEKSGLIERIGKDFIIPVVVLFGSASKAELKKDSDIDLAIFSPTKKEIDLTKYEKKLGRKVHIFVFEKKESVKPPELLNNILNGRIILGSW